MPYLRLTLDTPADLEAIHRLITQFPEIINQPMSIIAELFYKIRFIFLIRMFKCEGWNESFIRIKINSLVIMI